MDSYDGHGTTCAQPLLRHSRARIQSNTALPLPLGPTFTFLYLFYLFLVEPDAPGHDANGYLPPPAAEVAARSTKGSTIGVEQSVDRPATGQEILLIDAQRVAISHPGDEVGDRPRQAVRLGHALRPVLGAKLVAVCVK